MLINTDNQRINNKHLIISSKMLQYNNNNIDRKQSKKIDREGKLPQHVPKSVQIQFAQFLNNLLEYANELTYFSINAFQTSSLRRVQINTLVKWYCSVPIDLRMK